MKRKLVLTALLVFGVLFGGGSIVSCYSEVEQPEYYSVLYSESTEYTVEFSSETTRYVEGEIVEFTIIAESGYEITSVAYNGIILSVNSANTYGFTMPAEDVTLTINSKLITYTVSYTESDKYGVTFTSGSQEYAPGDIVEFTVVATSDYEIISVAYNGILLLEVAENTYSFEMPSRDVILTINSDSITYTISYTTSSQYSVNFTSGSQEYAPGDTVEFTVVATNGYQITSVLYNETFLAPSGNIYSFTMPKTNVILTINTEVITYTVSYTASNEYTVTFTSGTLEYAPGDRVEFIVEAATGHSLTVIAYNGITLTPNNSNTYSFTMPAEDVTLTINTTENVYTVSYQASSEYTVNFTSNSNEYNYLDTVEFTVEASTGYSITSVAYNGITLTPNNSNTYSFTMPAEDVTLTINTTENVYTVSYQASSEYTVNFTSNSNEYNYLDTVEFTVEASTGYSIASVAYNGTILTATSENTYSFTMPAEDVTLTIISELITYTVSYTESDKYGVTFTSGTQEYLPDDIVEFTIVASEGYKITSVAYNGTSINATNENTYSFTMPAEDVTLNIEIEAFYYSVTTENTPSLPTNVIIHVSTNDGTNDPLTDGAIVGQTIHIYFEYPGPENGYLFNLSINNGQIEYNEVQESYYFTFVMPAEDVVISVNWYGSY